LVVAIHDVTPECLDEIRFLINALDQFVARPRVFKVVPQHLPESLDLVALLREEQERGSEIVMHGFTHETSGRLRGPLPGRLRARIFAPRAAEFISLSPADMEARLRAGREIFSTAGLRIRGFCAPGWLGSPELRAALRGTGFGYEVTMTRVIDLQAGRGIATAWIGYMGAGAVQEQFVGVADGLNLLTAPLYRVLKVFLHPQHARSSSACRRILDVIPTLMRDRSLVTYGQLIGA
jgi:predicted deacetylase